MTEQEQARIEKVREAMWEIISTEAAHISCASYEGDNEYLMSVIRQFLSLKDKDGKPMVAILSDDQSLPEYHHPNYTIMGDEGRRIWDNKKIGMRAVQQDMLASNFRRVIIFKEE